MHLALPASSLAAFEIIQAFGDHDRMHMNISSIPPRFPASIGFVLLPFIAETSQLYVLYMVCSHDADITVAYAEQP